MVKSEQQRQKKLARRRAKDHRAKQQLVQQKQQLASLMGKMTAASSGKIVHCAIGEFEAGMGMVGFSRSRYVTSLPSGIRSVRRLIS